MLLTSPGDVGGGVSDTASPLRPAALLTFLAALMVAVGSSVPGPLIYVAGVPLTVGAFALASRAMWRIEDARRLRDWKPTVVVALAAMAALGIVSPGSGGFLWYEIPRRAFAVSGVLLIALFGSDNVRWQRRAVTTAIVLSAVIQILTPIATPNPPIDVFAWTTEATAALLRHVHPYTVLARDVYDGSRDYGFTVAAYPYMPATLLVFAPFTAVLHDFRFALALCLPIAIVLARAAARRMDVGRDVTDAITLALIFHPDGALIVRSGWTESLLLLALAAFVYLQARWPGGVAQSVAFCLIPSLKQYFLAPIALYVALMRTRWRTLSIGLGAAALTVVPFLVWNWHATMTGILFQMRAPLAPRVNSTSLVSVMLLTTGHYPAIWTSVVAQAIGGAIAGVRLKHARMGGLLLGSAISLFATFLTGWQAFVNYYYFVFAILLFCSLTLAAKEEA